MVVGAVVLGHRSRGREQLGGGQHFCGIGAHSPAAGLRMECALCHIIIWVNPVVWCGVRGVGHPGRGDLPISLWSYTTLACSKHFANYCYPCTACMTCWSMRKCCRVCDRPVHSVVAHVHARHHVSNSPYLPPPYPFHLQPREESAFFIPLPT